MSRDQGVGDAESRPHGTPQHHPEDATSRQRPHAALRPTEVRVDPHREAGGRETGEGQPGEAREASSRERPLSGKSDGGFDGERSEGARRRPSGEAPGGGRQRSGDPRPARVEGMVRPDAVEIAGPRFAKAALAGQATGAASQLSEDPQAEEGEGRLLHLLRRQRQRTRLPGSRQRPRRSRLHEFVGLASAEVEVRAIRLRGFAA